MKNKIIALTLTTILALSSTSTFAAEKVNCNNNININDILKNYNIRITETVKTASKTKIQVTKAPTVKEPVTEVKTPAVTTPAVQTAKPDATQDSKPVATKPSTATEATKTTAVASNLTFEQKVVELVNVERQKNGLSPLTLDTAISNIARTKSKDMATNNYFAHQSPTYGSAGDMLSKSKINWSSWGENIAYGQRTPEAVVTAWMNSSGHRANILNTTFTKIGVGYATKSDGTPYWTQMFTR